MMTLNYNRMVTGLNVTPFKIIYGIWNVSASILKPCGSANKCVLQSVVLCAAVRSTQVAPFLSVCEMHNAGHCAGAGHCSYNWLSRENLLRGDDKVFSFVQPIVDSRFDCYL